MPSAIPLLILRNGIALGGGANKQIQAGRRCIKASATAPASRRSKDKSHTTHPHLQPPTPSPSHQRLETGALRSDLLPKRLISRTASFMQESMFTLDLTRLRAAALHVKGKVMRPRPVSRMHARRPQTRAAAPAVQARSTRNKD